MYLTFNEYVKLGGKAPQSAFPRLERMARRKLDYFTQNRIKSDSPEDVCSEVKDCITEYVDLIYEELSGEEVASFSNGSISVSFATKQGTLDDSLYQIAVEYLPIELITAAVN